MSAPTETATPTEVPAPAEAPKRQPRTKRPAKDASARTAPLVGRSVPRVEDQRLLTGRATYVDDIHLPRMLEVAFHRSPVAHAAIRSIDREAAAGSPGVHAVVTGAELVGSVTPIAADSLAPEWQKSVWPALAVDRVRFVGEAVVAVVADDRYRAEDAVEELRVDYGRLPVLASVADALADDAAPLHDGWDANWFARRRVRLGDVDGAFADAHGVVERDLVVHRQTGMPMEARVCIADFNPARGALTVWTATQSPHIIRTALADHLGLPENRVRVISPDVGGGFGIKAQLYPEELVLAALAMRLRRPVKWVEDRREHLVSAIHAREHAYRLAAAFDADGRIRGLRASLHVDTGAYSIYPYTSGMEVGMALGVLPGMYRIDAYECEAIAVATNKTPLGPYRGVARPSACFAMERLVDAVAAELDLDPVEVRRRNLIPSAEMPFTSVTGLQYDSGDFEATLDAGLETFDYAGARARQAAAREQGRYLGIGIASYVEQTAHGTSEFVKRGLPIIFGFDTSRVRMEPSGHVSVHVTTHSHGQGHETSMAQMVADVLAVPIEDVRVHFGDTADASYGSGTLGSRSIVMAGGASHLAAEKIRAKLLAIAAHELGVEAAQLELADGVVSVSGEPERSVAVRELARWAYQRPERLPDGMEPTLEETHSYGADPGSGTFSHAFHIALVEVDPTLGRVDVLDYVVAEDCGRIVNPMIVDGQVVGGVAQGIGGALLEEIVYDDAGQPLTTALMDYRLPTALDMPRVRIRHLESLSPFTVGGIKGMGEGGAIAPGPVIAGAVQDALAPFDPAFAHEIPLTPERVLGLIGRASRVTP